MNVVEAYIKFKGHLVIYLSGMSGCGKTSIAKKISQTFKIQFLDQFSYYKENYSKKVSLPDGSEFINWHSDDAVDWNKFNNDIEKLTKNGVIVTGFSFPTDKILVQPDMHIHLITSKQICLEKRRKFIEKNKTKFPEEFNMIGTNSEKLKMNQIIYPYYLAVLKRMKVDKFININELKSDQIYSEIFDYIIERIQKFLYEEYPKIKKNNNKITCSSQNTDSKIEDSEENSSNFEEEISENKDFDE